MAIRLFRTGGKREQENKERQREVGREVPESLFVGVA